ncbi:rhomboid-like protein [Yinghuangia soli]|uniref:Uncharacterized protein n=1 Tax=Yinghuangia soli TaxID=2908204 RepID=A0AA41TZZ5_9ACTN|nr:rhomboid-like protein [Yinghuangia soli]MCF2528016.1 hypothetical protein [Yinghuangia soli]
MRHGGRMMLRALRGVHRWMAAAPGTYIWLAVMYATTFVYLRMPAESRTAFLRDRSTNIAHLHEEPLRVLAASAFWAEGAHLVKFTVIFTVVFAVAERWMGTWRWLAVAVLGHVGATYASQAVVLAGIEAGSLPHRLRHAVDVGPSYALMAVAGVLFHGIAGRWRWAYLAVLAVYVGAPAFAEHDFTAAGHVAAVLIGLSCAALVQGRPRWDPGASLPRRMRQVLP